MYGAAMLTKIPFGGYEMLTQDEISSFNPLDHDDDADVGFLITGDFEIDPNFHEMFDPLPPMPEKLAVSAAHASEFQKECMNDSGQNLLSSFKQEQLSLNLYNKENYTLHNYMLRFFLEQGGVKIKKLTQIVRYRQSNWMADFIENLIEKRRGTSDESLKAYYKVRLNSNHYLALLLIMLIFIFQLLVNSSFGFSSLRVGDFISLKVAKCQQDAVRHISNPLFKSFNILENNLALCELYAKRVVVRNHLMVASAILERSKLYFYRCFYQGFNQYFRERGLRFSTYYYDTDSCIFSINTTYEEAIAHMSNIKLGNNKICDMSFLDDDHPCYSSAMKNKPNTWKSEVGKSQICEIVILKKKSYSILLDDDSEKLKCKGITKSLVSKFITHQHYKDALLKGKRMKVKMRMLRRLNQMISKICSDKLALTNFSTSRWLKPPLGLTSLAFGNCLLLGGENETVSEESIE